MPFKRYCATVVFLAMSLGTLPAMASASPSLSSSFAFSDSSPTVPDLLFKDGRGQEHTLRDFIQNDLKGRYYVLLNIWATWCVPCVLEMPSLDKMQALMGPRNLAIIALSQDREGHVAVPGFYRQQGLSSLKVYFDPQGIATRRLRLRGLPTSVLINPQGEEIGRVSSRVDWDQFDNIVFIDKIVNAQAWAAYDAH